MNLNLNNKFQMAPEGELVVFLPLNRFPNFKLFLHIHDWKKARGKELYLHLLEAFLFAVKIFSIPTGYYTK